MAREASAGRPRRRTQSERSAFTRERVIQATVDCIVEGGLASTTAARIAERSGVTWGAIAHQFGDKESVLLAVLEHGFQELAANLESLGAGRESPAGRVSLLVDETWKRLNRPAARAFLEIMLSGRSEPEGARKSRNETMMVALSRRIWSDLFDEFGVDPGTGDTVRKLLFAALLGLAVQAMIGPRAPRFTREIAMLERTVVHLLGLEGAERDAGPGTGRPGGA